MTLGRVPALAHRIKGRIRKTLILGRRSVPVRFIRRLMLDGETVRIVDELFLDSGSRFMSLSIGDEFFVRYVPQSRYFQPQELDVSGFVADAGTIAELNRSGHVRLGSRLAGGRLEREAPDGL